MKTTSENNDFLWAALHDTGLLVQIPAVMSVPALIMSLFYKEWFSLVPFLSMTILSLVLGQGLRRFPPKVQPLTERPLSMIVVAFSWLFVVLLGAIPFMGVAYGMKTPDVSVEIFRRFSNAFFESMSGFTSTGLTVVPDPSSLPACLQFWRSLMEWVGGAGVVLLALLLIKPAEDAKNLYVAEVRKTLFDNSIAKTVKWIWIIYLGYTAFAVLLFKMAGMPFWEALNHGLTAISTGGFTVTPDGFGHYSDLIKLSAVFVIILGALSFHSHYFFWVKKDRAFPLRQSQVRTFLVCWVIGIFVFMLARMDFGQKLPAVDYIFQWTSALGTCGFNSVPIQSMHDAFLLVLVAGMVIGGCSGSTTGGIKTDRFAWAVKSLAWRIKSIWRPGVRKVSFFYDGKRVSQQKGLLTVESAVSMILLWLGVIFFSSFLLLIILRDQFSFLDILFEAASALGSVGLSAGVVSSALPDSAKYLFSLLMWMGRLEILAVIVLFSMPKIYLKK